MEHPGFFDRAGPFTLAEIAEATKSEVAKGSDPDQKFNDIRTLNDAGRDHVSFIDNIKYLLQLAETSAGAVLTAPANVEKVPDGVAVLATPRPYHGFSYALRLFYPTSLMPMLTEPGQPAVHPTAQLEDDGVVESGAFIGPEADIGRGTRVAAGAVVGARCAVGRNCYIGAQATVAHTLIGDNVIIHSGVRLGQDGFGFAMGREGHLKVPQIGRVIVQDHVEIGSNTSVDRGALKDTIIGEGTKIDNLVQIGHNVVIGRHCVIVAQTGISGSTELGDFVVMGGQSGAVGHIKIGTGAQIAGMAHPTHDVPPGARYAGTPAQPLKLWAKELALMKRLVQQGRGNNDDDSGAGNA